MNGRGRGAAGAAGAAAAPATLTPTGDYFRVFKTLLTMLSKRGYVISEDDLAMDKAAFDARFVKHGIIVKEVLSLHVEKPGAKYPEDQLLVKWTDGPKVGVHPIRSFLEELQQRQVKHGILVVETAVSPFAKQAMNSFKPGIVMEAFSYAQLKFDITSHKMVPHHKVLTPAEKTKLLTQLGVRDTQLPRMQTTDPVARYFGLVRGTVVEITRNSDTSGSYVTYRIVMPA